MFWSTLVIDRGGVKRQMPRAFGFQWRVSARKLSAPAQLSWSGPGVLAPGDDPAGGADRCCRTMRRSQSAEMMAAGMYGIAHSGASKAEGPAIAAAAAPTSCRGDRHIRSTNTVGRMSWKPLGGP